MVYFDTMYYVYILKSMKDAQLYIGVTDDLRRRFQEHTDGKTKSTAYRRPLKLVYYEAYLSWKDAEIREKRLKQFAKGYAQLKKRILNSINEA